MTPGEPAGGSEHRVAQGECVAQLAKRHGLLPDTIWRHPANRTLREARPGGRVLLPGDRLHVPERRRKEHPAVTEQRHRFVRKGLPARLRLRLRREGEPRADVAYRLEVDGRIVAEGRSDAEGRIVERIAPDARRGRLVLRDTGEVIPLRLGHLDPPDSITGAQSRLRNLGRYAGAVDGRAGAQTRLALEAFQAEQRLAVTGELDADTAAALRERHGG